MKTCPKCKLSNPPSAIQCDCGYTFPSRSVHASDMAATSKNKNDWCEVTLTGIDIPFWRLVGFLVKLAVAMIPAAIIISIVFTLIGFLLAALGIGALAAS